MELTLDFVETKMSKEEKPLQLDRLSMLPDELLINILSLTKSYRSAVWCSSLSKRWMNLYTKLPHLYFTDAEFLELSFDEEFLDSSDSLIDEVLMEIVSKGISCHTAAVETFSFEFKLIGTDKREITELCSALISNPHVKHVHVRAVEDPIGTVAEVEPLISSTSLETLSLHGFFPNVILDSFYRSESSFAFPKLRVLDLADFAFKTPWTDLLSRCPVLEYLKLSAGFYGSSFPLTISSNTMTRLDLQLRMYWKVFDPFVVNVHAPQLMWMNLDAECYMDSFELSDRNPSPGALYGYLGQRVVIRMQAPKLLELTGSGNDIYALEFKGLDRLGKQLKCKKAKWIKESGFSELSAFQRPDNITEHDPTLLPHDICSCTKSLTVLHSLSSLKTLELGGICAYPVEFWQMLTCLPLCHSLILDDCVFKHDILTERYKKAHLDVPLSKARSLREVKLTNVLSFYFGERQMLDLICRKAPLLGTLFFDLLKIDTDMLSKCEGFLRLLLSAEDKLIINDSDCSMQFVIFKNSCNIQEINGESPNEIGN